MKIISLMLLTIEDGFNSFGKGLSLFVDYYKWFLVSSVTNLRRNVNAEICFVLEYLCIRAQAAAVGWACRARRRSGAAREPYVIAPVRGQ